MIRALSFSGAGFCGVYHLGATHALSKRLNFDDLKFTGASAGSIAAVSAAVWHGDNLDHQFAILKGLRTACDKYKFRNQLQESFYELFDEAYPEDVLEYANQRAFISLSDVSNKLKMKNVLVSEFDSRDHLLECLVASCLVPGWAGYKSRVINGKKYIDGGFTVNLPNLYPNETIRIQPFSTSEIHADISPLLTNGKDQNRVIAKNACGTFTFYLTGENLHRVAVRALFPGDEKWFQALFNEGILHANLYCDKRL